MNTSTTFDFTPHPITPAPKTQNVEQMKREFAQRIQYASMKDEDLVLYIVDMLEKSYAHRESPFHEYHLQVDLLSEECARREKSYLFDRAFQQFDSM